MEQQQGISIISIAIAVMALAIFINMVNGASLAALSTIGV